MRQTLKARRIARAFKGRDCGFDVALHIHDNGIPMMNIENMEHCTEMLDAGLTGKQVVLYHFLGYY
jgi:hypothetical protein